jgi:hypothetical protein
VDPSSLRVAGVLDYDRDYSLIAKLADWGIRMHMGVVPAAAGDQPGRVRDRRPRDRCRRGAWGALT